jgi:hypothetical protein
MENAQEIREQLEAAREALARATISLIASRSEDYPLRLQVEIMTAAIRVREASDCVTIALSVAI